MAKTAELVQVESGTLLTVQDVADELRCSTRHVQRMAEAKRMPRPLKLGQLVRWRRDELRDWLDRGCPSLDGE